MRVPRRLLSPPTRRVADPSRGPLRREWHALVVFILALAWFAVGAPRASEAVRQVRAEAARSLDVAEIRQALQSTGTQPDPVLAELLAQAQALVAQGSPWNLLVAAVLTDSQRQQALALEPGQPPVPPGHLWYVEPELPALALALLQRHGLGERNLPAPPTVDPWPGVDTRRRARGLLALIAADGVTEEQGHVLLHITLDAMALQAESAQVERALGRALPEDVRTAVLEARYAARPGAPGGRP